MSKPTTVVFLALALLGALVGCGGGDGDDADPKAEYVQKADEICALGSFRIGTDARKRFGTTQPGPAEQKEFAVEVVVPHLREVVRQLRGLTPPEGDQQRVNAVWAALDEAIDTVELTPGLLAEPDAGGAFDQANQLAREYGFNQCGSS
jgi:hypothetical protein